VEIAEFEERRRFVEQACGDDEDLKERLLELIDNHFRAGSFQRLHAIDPADRAGDLAN